MSSFMAFSSDVDVSISETVEFSVDMDTFFSSPFSCALSVSSVSTVLEGFVIIGGLFAGDDWTIGVSTYGFFIAVIFFPTLQTEENFKAIYEIQLLEFTICQHNADAYNMNIECTYFSFFPGKFVPEISFFSLLCFLDLNIVKFNNKIQGKIEWIHKVEEYHEWWLEVVNRIPPTRTTLLDKYRETGNQPIDHIHFPNRRNGREVTFQQFCKNITAVHFLLVRFMECNNWLED